MRIRIDLPSDLMHAAKAKAAQRGESLKDLFTRAIAEEIGSPRRARSGSRLTFPLIGRDSEPKVEVTNADIAAALEAQDVERFGQ
jgi:hypothetical protein